MLLPTGISFLFILVLYFVLAYFSNWDKKLTKIKSGGISLAQSC